MKDVFLWNQIHFISGGGRTIYLLLNMVQGDAVIGKIALVYLQMLISVIGIDMNL